MSPWAALDVAFAFVPAAIAVGVHLRMRREDRRLEKAREAERAEWRVKVIAEGIEKARRQSFSAWPFEHKK